MTKAKQGMSEQQVADYNEMEYKDTVTVKEAFVWVNNELKASNEKFPDKFRSQHEGYAVIKEEFDELWDEIKSKDASKANTRMECVQMAAMCIKFLSSDIMEVKS